MYTEFHTSHVSRSHILFKDAQIDGYPSIWIFPLPGGNDSGYIHAFFALFIGVTVTKRLVSYNQHHILLNMVQFCHHTGIQYMHRVHSVVQITRQQG